MQKMAHPIVRFGGILLIGVLMALILIEQRLEARENEQKIRRLKTDIENIEMTRREMVLLIQKEESRLNMHKLPDNYQPITRADVRSITIDPPSPAEKGAVKKPAGLDSILSFLIGN